MNTLFFWAKLKRAIFLRLRSAHKGLKGRTNSQSSWGDDVIIKYRYCADYIIIRSSVSVYFLCWEGVWYIDLQTKAPNLVWDWEYCSRGLLTKESWIKIKKVPNYLWRVLSTVIVWGLPTIFDICINHKSFQHSKKKW